MQKLSQKRFVKKKIATSRNVGLPLKIPLSLRENKKLEEKQIFPMKFIMAFNEGADPYLTLSGFLIVLLQLFYV